VARVTRARVHGACVCCAALYAFVCVCVCARARAWTKTALGVEVQRLSFACWSRACLHPVWPTAGLVLETGYIRKCYDVTVDGVTVSDLLRDMLLNEESDHAELFSADEKAEFIYDLFRMVCTGGSMSQYEDDWNPYLTVTKVRDVGHLCDVGTVQVAHCAWSKVPECGLAVTAGWCCPPPSPPPPHTHTRARAPSRPCTRTSSACIRGRAASWPLGQWCCG
jgi:hypothetical protein